MILRARELQIPRFARDDKGESELLIRNDLKPLVIPRKKATRNPRLLNYKTADPSLRAG